MLDVTMKNLEFQALNFSDPTVIQVLFDIFYNGYRNKSQTVWETVLAQYNVDAKGLKNKNLTVSEIGSDGETLTYTLNNVTYILTVTTARTN